MSERIRICRAHDELPLPFVDGWCCVLPPDDSPCDIVGMVWSADGSALLAIKECENHNRLTDLTREDNCVVCDGRGYTYQATVAEYGGVMNYLDMDPLMEFSPTTLVAVVPLP